MASSAGGRDYFLEVLQHPSRARSCGWGDSSDFRPIDPPSILQLFARTPDGRILKSPRDIYEAINFVVHVKLWSNEGDRDQSFTPKPISRRGRKPNKAKLQSLMLLQAPPVVYDAMPKPRIAEKSEELEDHDDPEGPDELGEHGMTEDVIAPSQRSGSTGASSTSVTTPAIASAASVSAAATAAGLASASTSTPPVASMTRAVAAAAPAAVSSPLGVASISPTTTIPPMAGPPPLHMALFGNLVSQSYFLTGMNEERGVFFIFDQICLRVEGRYRLKFFLNDVFHSQEIRCGAPALASVLSDPFTSYSWKRFPGMQLATPLTVRLAKQGTGLLARQVPRPPPRGRKLPILDSKPTDEPNP